MISIDPAKTKQVVLTRQEVFALRRELESMFVKLNTTAPKGMYNFGDIEQRYPHVAAFTKTVNQS